jgi:ribosomal 30S subunit maturation factor RimM
MKIRKLALCGAGVLALTIGAAGAQNDPYTHNPTPQERAQTQDLNAQASDQASSDTDTQTGAQQQYQGQQQDYQNQQQQYQQQMGNYQAQQDRYRDDRAAYNYDRTHPYTWWHDRYEQASLNHFYDIPRDELVNLRVMREDGYTVGRISEIDRHGDGRVSAVRVAFRDGETAWVKARDLRYDPDDRIVFTDLSVRDLHELARNS